MTAPMIPGGIQNLSPSGIIQAPTPPPSMGGDLAKFLLALRAQQTNEAQAQTQAAQQQAEARYQQQQVALEKAKQDAAQKAAQVAAQQALDKQRSIAQSLAALTTPERGPQQVAPTPSTNAAAPGLAGPLTVPGYDPLAAGAAAAGPYAGEAFANPGIQDLVKAITAQRAERTKGDILSKGQIKVVNGKVVAVNPDELTSKPTNDVVTAMYRVGIPTYLQPEQMSQAMRDRLNIALTKSNTEKTPQTQGQSASAQRAGSDTAAAIVKDTDDLYSAKRDYQQVAMMRDLLSQGIQSGFGAEIQQRIAQASVKFGWASPEQANVVTNTQVYGQLAASRMAELARKFNTRGLTQADQQFVKAAAASDYTWTIPALKRSLDIQEQMIRDNAAEHNRRVQSQKSWDEDTRNANLVDIGSENASVPPTNGATTKSFIMPDGTQVTGTLDATTGRYKGTYRGQLGWLN